jgi:hypothetical protein
MLRRIHRNTLEYVNYERIKKGEERLVDLPFGLRDDANNPIAKALGKPFDFEGLVDLFDSNDDFFSWLDERSHWAQIWLALFATGKFYRDYNDALVGINIRRRRDVLKRIKPAKMAPLYRERYLRLMRLLQYAVKQKNQRESAPWWR